MPWGVDPRAPILETLQLVCACGAEILGNVLVGRAEAAVALFEAHHRGPKCAPRWLRRRQRRLRIAHVLSPVLAELEHTRLGQHRADAVDGRWVRLSIV